MKRLKKLYRCLAIGVLMSIFTTLASAHQPPPKENKLNLLGVGEMLELAFLAGCNGPQPTDEYSIVPLRERSIRFNVVVTDRAPGTSSSEYVFPIEILHGEAKVLNISAAATSNLFTVAVKDVSGRGVCAVSVAGRQANANGETVFVDRMPLTVQGVENPN
jgi:hypothetical protein